MTESMQVIPWTGEQLDISTVEGAKRGMQAVSEMRGQLTEFNNACRQTLIDEAERRGQLSWEEEDGTKVRVSGAGVVSSYDMRALGMLRDAGLPDERWNALVSWKPIVDERVVIQLRRTPKYAQIIDAAVTETKEKYRAVRFE